MTDTTPQTTAEFKTQSTQSPEKTKKPLIIGGVVLVILLIIGGIVMMVAGGTSEEEASADETINDEFVEEPIPTVDASVIVELNPNPAGTEVDLVVENAPAGTDTIDAELSYGTTDKGLQGAIAMLQVEDGAAEKTITLGTCSSGSCVYHEVDGDIQVVLRFSGDYGEKLFQNDFSISN